MKIIIYHMRDVEEERPVSVTFFKEQFIRKLLVQTRKHLNTYFPFFYFNFCFITHSILLFGVFHYQL